MEKPHWELNRRRRRPVGEGIGLHSPPQHIVDKKRSISDLTADQSADNYRKWGGKKAKK